MSVCILVDLVLNPRLDLTKMLSLHGKEGAMELRNHCQTGYIG